MPARAKLVSGTDRTNGEGLPPDDADSVLSGDAIPAAVRLKRAAPISISDVPCRIPIGMRAAGDKGEADSLPAGPPPPPATPGLTAKFTVRADRFWRRTPTPAPRLLLLRILWPTGACAPLGTDDRWRRLAVVSTRSSRRVKRSFSGAAPTAAAGAAAAAVATGGPAIGGAAGAGLWVGDVTGGLFPAPVPMTELTPRPAATAAAAAAPDTAPETAAAAAAAAAAPRRDGVRGESG